MRDIRIWFLRKDIGNLREGNVCSQMQNTAVFTALYSSYKTFTHYTSI